jgi:hypothetical protein
MSLEIATWILAIATAVLALEGGTALVQWRARWDARAEEAKTDQARRENDLHRRRFTQVWEWQRSQAQGEERVRSARWYGEWTGADAPYRGGQDDGPLTPGLHTGNADEAYQNNLDFLRAVYEPGRLARPRASWRRAT